MVPGMDEKEEKKFNRRLRQKEKEAKLRRDDFIKAALEHRQGREYLFWLMEISKLGQNPYTAHALNTAFQCGELNVGQQIQAHIIEVSPGGFLALLKEKEEDRLDGRRPSDDTASSDSDDSTASAADGSGAST